MFCRQQIVKDRNVLELADARPDERALHVAVQRLVIQLLRNMLTGDAIILVRQGKMVHLSLKNKENLLQMQF